MKKILICSLALIVIFVASCNKEAALQSSEEIGIAERFGPAEDALPVIKKMYQDYDVWMRMDFTDVKEVTNAILVQDPSNRFGATPIEENMKPSAIMFMDTLLHNASKEYVKKVFPREFFFVKTYNGSYWKQDIYALGRGRLIVCWPNERTGVQPITVPETHYYQDSVVTRLVWGALSGMLSQRMEVEIPGFTKAGMAYDNGKSFDEIAEKYPSPTDPTRIKLLSDLAVERGVISGSGTRSYQVDLGEWINLIVTESYDNIKKQYLDNSPKRAEKYKIFIEYLKKEYNWDIQAAGNKYREKLNSFKK